LRYVKAPVHPRRSLVTGHRNPLRGPGRGPAFSEVALVGGAVTQLAIPAPNAYLPGMFKAFDFCLPTRSTSVPTGPDWLHEVKYDGYRLRLERDGDRVRLITRGGYDWTKRYPWITEAARKVQQRRFVLDGEAVILGVDGISDFNARHIIQQ
jgi:ATP dependent DNA ligase domain